MKCRVRNENLKPSSSRDVRQTHGHSCGAVWSPPVSASPPLCLCAVPETPQLFTPGLHQLLSSPSNTPNFPAVLTRSFFELQYGSTPPACLLHSLQPEAPNSPTCPMPHPWSAPNEPCNSATPVLSQCSALGSSSYRTPTAPLESEP